MGYVSKEQIENARSMDLLTYLERYEPQELVHFGGNTFCTREHDSLKISNGKWFWFSRGFGGRSALDYLVRVKEKTLPEAVEMILGISSQPVIYSERHTEKEKPKMLLLPKQSQSNAQAYNYLLSRGIDSELIDHCIDTGQFYESFPHHSAVFIGKDEKDTPRYAAIRGIGNDYIGEAAGSDKRYSFNFPADESSELCLFESAIDLLSFATLLKMNNRSWNSVHLVSLAGVYRSKDAKRDSAVPLALSNYLQNHDGIHRIFLCLDNDIAGHAAAEILMKAIPLHCGIEAAERFPPRGKDYNDYLCEIKHLPKTKKRVVPER